VSKPESVTIESVRPTEPLNLYCVPLAFPACLIRREKGVRPQYKFRGFLLEIAMTTVISYKLEAALVIGSAVATILFAHIYNKCKESNQVFYESFNTQFDLGFSDVEFYSALKTLKTLGYLQTQNMRDGERRYIPHSSLFDEDIKNG